MSLPRPPIDPTTPIPNQPFEAAEVYYLETNQGQLPLGEGLYIDPQTGSFTNIEPSPYIYCTPQYSNLPVTYPPYGCNTEVNTAGVTDFDGAWYNCSFSSFPCIDTSGGTSFSYTWAFNYEYTEFPYLNVSKGEDFGGCWSYTGLTSFPKLNFSSATNFGYFPDSYGTWQGCFYLTSFPPINTSKVETFVSTWYACSFTSFPFIDTSSGLTFLGTWQNCSNLEEFPAGMFDNCSATDFRAWFGCALSQESVDNILVSIDTAGQSNGVVHLHGGTSSTPGTSGLVAKANLEAKGWTVLTN